MKITQTLAGKSIAGNFRMAFRYFLGLFVIVVLCSSFATNSWCQEYNVIRVADSISNPELGLFNATIATPVIEGDYVVFRTQNSVSTVANIWSWNRKSKQFTKLVDLSMAAPGGTGNFTDLAAGMGGPILKDGIVIFGARDSASLTPPSVATGIFSVPVTGGAIQRVANYNTAVPGGIGNFFNFSATSAHTGNFSFSDGIVGLEGDFGGGPIGNSGVYQSDISGNNQAPIADSLHGIGDLFPITNFTHIEINSNRAAFIGGNVFGLYALYSTSLPAILPTYNEVINVTTVLPGATGGFSFVIPSVRIFGDNIFFIARDSTPQGNNDRRTLYQIPFSGGSPIKIISNFDTLEGLSSIELSSISSYDINQTHLLIRAKAPGTTAEQGLYLFDRATQQFKQIFTLNQTILERNFGFLAEIQPGAIAADSSRVVTALGGSALFVGPFTYIAMLSRDEEDQDPLDRVAQTLTEISAQLSEARNALPPKPRKSLSASKKDAINAKRASILEARNSISDLLKNLVAQEQQSGDSIREQYPNFTSKNLSQLVKLRRTGSSNKVTSKAAKRAWKLFDSLIQKIQSGGG